MRPSPVADELPFPFGLHADSGQPLPGFSEELLSSLGGEVVEPHADPQVLAARAALGDHLGVMAEIEDPADLSQAGWCAIYAPSFDKRKQEALEPLIAHRRRQVGDRPGLFQIFQAETGYRAGDTASTWLGRRGVRMDEVNPSEGVPFYVLIVGPPDEIPFEFQYSLDLYWGVGRIWFDTPEQFRQYADSVVAFESRPEPPTARRMTIFAPRTPSDAATCMFAEEMALPLSGAAIADGKAEPLPFPVQSFIGDPATKENLVQICRGEQTGTPALLFTGSHGLGLDFGDPRQEATQGALVCQDWPGSRGVRETDYFAASDIPEKARLHGMIFMIFACYGVGWPQFDNYDRLSGKPARISSKPMLARLPQALLSHANGGALAVLGHIDRAWSYSFRRGKKPQNQSFRSLTVRLMRGEPVGLATDSFNMRWSALSTELVETLYRIHVEKLNVDPIVLAARWVARDDARNYIVFGDPAVALKRASRT